MPPSQPSSPPPVALCFGASDPTGASGIQADLLTLGACGVHPLSVLTALTSRDTRGQESCWPLDAGQIDEQARLLLEDLRVSAFRIGPLFTAASAAVLAEIIADYPDIPLVLSATPGASDDEDLPDALRDLLLPQATVLCCNARDAAQLAEPLTADNADSPGTPASCARHLLALGAAHVLISTEGPSGQLVDTLYGAQGVLRTDAHRRLPGRQLGAGSTLAAALTAFLARGMSVSEAVGQAISFTQTSLAAAFAPGMGGLVPWAGAQR